VIPASHVLLLGLAQLLIGLLGLVLRRAGLVVLASGLVMLDGVMLLFCAGIARTGSTSQAEGVVVLAVIVAVALVGAAVLYSFHRFRRTVVLDEHDRLSN